MALANGLRQEEVMARVMALPDIDRRWDSPEVERMVLEAIAG